MLLLIDNYDSFTYNLAHYFMELGCKVKVVRNDQISIEQIEQLNPSHIVISPGPCTPNESGISLEAIGAFAQSKPILGVCLGHQCIAQYFGASVTKASQVMHGKTALVEHNSQGIFANIHRDFIVTRYHSLCVEPNSVPEDLEVTAWCDEGQGNKVIMGLQHKSLAIFGVQFHPESVLSEFGHHILKNFISR
ncbi:para-aminobenzoate synthase component II [Catenovulum agarivorans DS-2]|uniref:Para-aminobenzoate synthase component II n=1 Tax=Catenovulum agarivorans DS-2 TaxID=1328313 RepID=W7QBK4_9ALTE|nr:aminodeoxychorismate/anthranilate synthase component II [Catenovulum agarivorans]EWH09356.1 para-aminobenzoate synthase component II [Catenovulum agarivorans DS-2]